MHCYNAAVNRRATSFAVLGAMALALWLIFPRLRHAPSFDAVHVYLPMARAVLEQGAAFMQRPESLVTGPIAYLYPALLGAAEALVRGSNAALYCATIALGFMALRLAHSWQAGLAAALLLAVSPTLRPFVADVLTEPPFFFLTALWIVAVACVASGRSRAWIAVGALALGLAALTRPAIMYFAPLMIAIHGVRMLRAPAATPGKAIESRLALLHLGALGLIAAWILRNALTFGFPAIATGAGAALYFGVNPAVDGFDPAYYGLNYDSGLAQDSSSHLSLHADRRLRAIALVELRDTPLAVLLEMAARKAAAFLFVTSAESSGEPLAVLRAWRIALVVLAFLPFFARRPGPPAFAAVTLALGALVVYMVGVHLPVVYHHRYSVGAIDVPLTLLAAMGLVEMARSARRAAATLAAMTLALGIGLHDAAQAGPYSPHPERIPNEVMWLGDVGSRFPIGPGRAPIDIAVTKDPRTPVWDLSMLQLDLALRDVARGGGCRALTLRFKPAGAAGFAEGQRVRVLLPAETSSPAPRRLTLGSTVPLALDREGTLRLEFECASPATAEIGTMAVIAPRREVFYRDRYLEQQRAANP
jgi:hypothetical protein